MPKKAIITGVTGQDGSYLADFLLSKGYEVHGVIRRVSTFPTERVDHLLNDPGVCNKRFFLHFGDLAEGNTIRRLLDQVGPDEFYNLAAQSHVRVSFDIPEYTANVTGVGTLRALEAIRDYEAHTGKRVKFYQASSSEMFGSAPAPQNEETKFHPRSPYGVAKVFAYNTVVNYREAYGLFACNGILFNHESERRGETFVTRKIVRAVARIKAGLEKKLALGNLDARRDWGYAPEYVEAMWLMLQQPEPDDYVIGTGESYSVRDFVRESFAYVGITDWEKYVETDPRYYRPAEVGNLVADARKAREKLGWQPYTTAPGLMRKMIRHELKMLNIPDPHPELACRICKSTDLYMFLDLGHHPHSDLFRTMINGPETTYPLRLARCRGCGLVQLDYVVPPQELYQDDYYYESSITKTGDAHWTEFAETVSKKAGLKPGDGVVDIGSNDGTLLSKFKALGYKVCGIDPTPVVARLALERGVPTIIDFFDDETARKAREQLGSIKLITGTNVFAHIHDLDSVLRAVSQNLDEEGVFVFESPYFGNFFDGMQYDTAYHQHLSYLSLKPLIPFFRSYGLEIFDIDRRPIHGGSFRVYAGRNRAPGPAVAQMLAGETWTDVDMDEFARKVRQNREDLFNLIADLHKQGKSIVAVSSPAKGQTLLNYTGVGRFLTFATDKSKFKQGRYTPGTHLKIYGDEELIRQQPDYALLLAWNFASEIIRNNKEYKGKWIVPVPTPRIVESGSMV